MEKETWFGDDFGQKVDLTARIREILRNYPEGISIFKELIQNADDAGATEVSTNVKDSYSQIQYSSKRILLRIVKF